MLVSADEDGVHAIERLLVDVLRWHALTVDAAGCATLTDVVRAIGGALEALAASTEASIPLAVRVTVTGRSAAHGELFGLEQQLRAEVLALAAAAGPERLWIEKVRVRTAPPDDGAAVRARADALSDLQALLLVADQDPAFLQSLREDLLVMVTKAPIELQTLVPHFSEIRAGELGALVREVCPGLMAHIAGAD